jgi:uncharacterized protein CbrC (UPF0167 family)
MQETVLKNGRQYRSHPVYAGAWAQDVLVCEHGDNNFSFAFTGSIFDNLTSVAVN